MIFRCSWGMRAGQGSNLKRGFRVGLALLRAPAQGGSDVERGWCQGINGDPIGICSIGSSPTSQSKTKVQKAIPMNGFMFERVEPQTRQCLRLCSVSSSALLRHLARRVGVEPAMLSFDRRKARLCCRRGPTCCENGRCALFMPAREAESYPAEKPGTSEEGSTRCCSFGQLEICGCTAALTVGLFIA